jgi:hypothetical protein
MEKKHAKHLLKQLITKHGQVRHNEALEALCRQEKDYTVLGIYGDNQQPWMAHVEKATSPKDAAMKGINITYNKGENGVELEDIFVIEVVKGYVNGILGNDVVISLKDLKSKNCPWIN